MDICAYSDERLILAYRINQFVQTTRVKSVYARLTDAEKQEVVQMIKSGCFVELKALVDSKSNYSDLSIRNLRKMAARLGIPYYSTLSRESLVKAITHGAVKRTVDQLGTDPTNKDQTTPVG